MTRARSSRGYREWLVPKQVAQRVLYDCISKNPFECELLIVRSGKAANFAREGRDRRIQAVLAVGTAIKPATANLDELLDCRDFKNIIMALGVGFLLEPDGTLFRLDNLRYERIIIAMGSGAKGTETSQRILSLMERYMHPVIAAGHVYTASVSEPSRLSAEELERNVLTPDTRGLERVSLT